MKNLSLLYFAIFVCALATGYMVSSQFFQSDYDLLGNKIGIMTTNDRQAIKTLDNGQRGFLLISASELTDAKPRLDSIWLATYFPGESNIRLLPIYPSEADASSGMQQRLVQSFGLVKIENELTLKQDFVDILQNNNYWWSGYILFDETALVTLIDQLGGIDLNGRMVSGGQLIASLHEAGEHPQNNFSSELMMLQSMCKKASLTGRLSQLRSLISLFNDHIVSDVETSQLQAEVESIYASERQPTCSFPTLEISLNAQ